MKLAKTNFEPSPLTGVRSAEFGDEHPQRERPQTFGPGFWGERLNLLGEGVELFLDGGNELAPHLQSRAQPFREGQRLGPPFAAQPDALRQPQAAALGGEALAFTPELFALAAQCPPLFFRLGGDADDTHGFAIAAEIAIQFQGQFAGIGLVSHHAFMLGIEFDRMHDKRGDAEGAELAVEMKSAGTGFVNDEDLIGQGELFLDEGQEAGWREPLGGLGRLAIAHPHHTELFDVPVHGEFELMDSVLRFGIQRRIRFHRHV